MPLPPLLATLASAPEAAAVLLDVDGVLAPIVDDPEAARVPDETREELRRLARRYALVACVTGRPTETARRIVGVDELVVVGEHGLGLDPRAAEFAEAVERVAAAAEWPAERKEFSVAFHFRTAPDEREARARLEDVARRAEREGLVPHWGRKVLEVRPPVAADKGVAVERTLAEHGLERALFAGDDTTDLDAFRAVARLPLGIRVAVASEEGPPELREAADLVVDGPAELLGLLREL